MWSTLLTLSLLAAAPASAPAGHAPLKLSPAQIDTLRMTSEKDRNDTEAWLKGDPSSYLAAIARVDFEGRTSLTIGSDAKDDVRIDDPAVAPHALTVSVIGDSFHVAAPGEGTFTWRKLEYHEAILPPSSVGLGRYMLRLSHQRYPAIIVFDPKSARFADYHGMAWFPYDPAYRFELPLRANPHPDTTIIMSTRGNARRAVRVGWFDFRIGGRTVSLEAHRLLEPGVDESTVSLFFRDATTGHESYGVGRYVDPQPLPSGDWRVDFNDAYNPACAFSPHYNCPIPSKANTLPIAIRAGEKDSHYAH